jgi:predicted nucleotidyltransferase
MMSKMKALIAGRLEARREIASSSVARIIADARTRAVDISVIGSLGKDDFKVHSDIDLLVHGPADSVIRLFVERLVAGNMRETDIPYDLLYEADLTPARVRELMHGIL